MHIPKREELTIQFIHRNALYVVAGLVVLVLTIVGLQRGGLLGPLVDLSDGNVTFKWGVSDHSGANGNNVILNNSLTATDTPNYDDLGVIMELERESNGNLKALPRFQGSLEYHSP